MLSVAFATIAEKEKQKIEKKKNTMFCWLVRFISKVSKIGCTAKYVCSNSLRIAPTVQFPPANLQTNQKNEFKMVLIGE